MWSALESDKPLTRNCNIHGQELTLPRRIVDFHRINNRRVAFYKPHAMQELKKFGVSIRLEAVEQCWWKLSSSFVGSYSIPIDKLSKYEKLVESGWGNT